MLRTSYLAYHKCYTLIVLHASRGLSKLRNKLWLNDLYGEDNASRCRSAPIPLYKDWLIVSLINQVDSTRASVMFSASCLIAGWILIFVGAARQQLDLPDVATVRRWRTSSRGSSKTWCVSERSQLTMETLPGDRRVYQE